MQTITSWEKESQKIFCILNVKPKQWLVRNVDREQRKKTKGDTVVELQCIKSNVIPFLLSSCQRTWEDIVMSLNHTAQSQYNSFKLVHWVVLNCKIFGKLLVSHILFWDDGISNDSSQGTGEHETGSFSGGK